MKNEKIISSNGISRCSWVSRMKQLSFAETEKEIKKELKLLKEIARKIAIFGEFDESDVQREELRLLNELRERKK